MRRLCLALALAACEHPSPLGPAPAPSASAEPSAKRDTVREVHEIGKTMAEAIRIMRETREKIQRTTVINVTEYPMKREREKKLRAFCLKLNGEVHFRGDRGPFICDSHEPMCDEPDYDAGRPGGCMEGPPHFIIYQVPVEALY